MAVLYTSSGPYYGVPFRITMDLRDGSNDLVTLAGADSEISKDGGSFLACTNEAAGGSLGSGFATLDLTAAEMSCSRFTVQVKGTNHKTFVYHGVTSTDIIYAGTVSAYAGGTPSLTLNTTDQLGSTTDGFYDGCFIVPIAGTGAGQPGRYASTETSYVGSTKVLTLASAFITALDATSVVLVYNAHVSTSTSLGDVNVVSISGDTTAANNLEADYDGTGYAKSASSIGTVDAVGTGGIVAGSIAASALDGKGDWNIGKTGYTVSAIGSGVVTAASIAASALDGKGDWNVGKTGYTVSSLGSGVIDAASIAASALDGKGDWNIGKTGYSIASGGISSAAFTAGAVDASALASDAVNEIQSGLATAAQISALNDINASDVWAEALGSTSLSASALLQIIAGVAAGKLSGAGTTTVTIRNIEDTGNLVVATVDAVNGNRSAIVITTPSD